MATVDGDQRAEYGFEESDGGVVGAGAKGVDGAEDVKYEDSTFLLVVDTAPPAAPSAVVVTDVPCAGVLTVADVANVMKEEAAVVAVVAVELDIVKDRKVLFILNRLLRFILWGTPTSTLSAGAEDAFDAECKFKAVAGLEEDRLDRDLGRIVPGVAEVAVESGDSEGMGHVDEDVEVGEAELKWAPEDVEVEDEDEDEDEDDLRWSEKACFALSRRADVCIFRKGFRASGPMVITYGKMDG
ncbi:hypothetical protein BG004_008323 [Podila humilis]|nr:hypothetical protein BG004_008323 [Podila humilis]